MKVVETTGIIDNNNILKIDKTINKQFLKKSVRVLILLPEENDKSDEIDEKLWLKSISNNSAFSFLNAPEEDIYSLSDGKSFGHEV
ncbi:MAG: hypothetical protein HN704_05345 [Bacteroidetes bacterium]|jgi:hypothetical protein|nr:hypothetical protein [Bacteroidota bacterium]MBT6685681.1 hypothetical protein [Bacteroidota bacterium]MBT7141905.1 hypothetical protein [Bacteroidota bacterium]MBT7491018.1 hypothetical protein [Bacteroidota bacterium]